jgi:organic hydroperoxide reductase OsmC/OhrA
MDLTARIKAPGLTQAEVDALVAQGNQACPVSNALRGNVEIRVKGELTA